MGNFDGFYDERYLDHIWGQERQILMVADGLSETRGEIRLKRGSKVIASASFGIDAFFSAIFLLLDLRRLREGSDDEGTLPDLARLMRHECHGDELARLLYRLAADFNVPMDHLPAKAWRHRGGWPTVEVFRNYLDILSEESGKYLVSKAHEAIKRGDIRDPALREEVKRRRQKLKPQLQPTEDIPSVEKKRGFLHRTRRKQP